MRPTIRTYRTYAGVILLGAFAAFVATGCPAPCNEGQPNCPSNPCSSITTCGECVSNVACGWCGSSCVQANPGAQRGTKPASCSATWTSQLNMCPSVGPLPPPAPPGPPPPGH